MGRNIESKTRSCSADGVSLTAVEQPIEEDSSLVSPAKLGTPIFKPSTPTDADKLKAYRLGYQAYRAGYSHGAKGEIYDLMLEGEEEGDEESYLQLFKGMPDGRDATLERIVDKASLDFVGDTTFCRPGVEEADIAQRFMDSDMPQGSMNAIAYTEELLNNAVNDSVHTSSPQMIGHMTSALPTYMQTLSKLIVAMNQNVVKTETAKTVTFLERECLAQLHKVLYKCSPGFYVENMQKPDVMLGLFTSGGTLANTTALWIARNSRLGPDGSFGGVQSEGMIRAMRHYSFDDVVIVGSQLMHYSMDKAADLIGVGVNGLVKIPVDSNYQVDLSAMEEYLIKAQQTKTLVLAMVGICGATETGAIDPLQKMAALAAKYNIHFHVDAAWGGPCIFSRRHRIKSAGIELADTITLDGHKQLWLPMGCGLVFLKDPQLSQAIRKCANYIIRKDSYDLGKFTLEGSRPAQAIYLQANLQVLGLKGYEVMFDRTVRVAKYMARTIMRAVNYELLVKPMTNILLYRWIPASLRQAVLNNTVTDEDNAYIDECNRKLQDAQKAKGTTFVSRTTIKCPKYDLKPIVALRVVIGNPLTSESDIDAVFADQDSLISGAGFTKDITPQSQPILPRNSSQVFEAAGEGSNYWESIWRNMNAKEKFIFNNDIDSFLDSLSTPDCFIEYETDSFQQSVIQKVKSSQNVQQLLGA